LRRSIGISTHESAKLAAMRDHLRFAGQSDAEQCEALAAIVRSTPLLMAVLEGLRDDGLPQAIVVAGALYNLVWNRLTGRPDLTGINDIDVLYFDPRDLSEAAEDAVIRRLDRRFADLPVPVQIRNQARVHLWFPEKFGIPLAPLGSADEMLGYFASRTHAIGVRLDAGGVLQVVAPFGLDDLFSFRLTPNPALANKATHDAKAARAAGIWPELTVIPWPAG
jgi:hypothetical protein